MNSDVDVVVVGGGASGIAAACSAASIGASVLLVDRADEIGGTAVHAAVGTICGLYQNRSDKPVYHPGMFASEFAERLQSLEKSKPLRFKKLLWFLPYHPANFLRITNELFARYPSLDFCTAATVQPASIEAGRISSVHIDIDGKQRTVQCKSVIDCSGAACFAEMCGVPLIDSVCLQDAALVAEFSHASDELADKRFLKEVLRGVQDAVLPAVCGQISIVPGSLTEISFRTKIPAYSEKVSSEHGLYSEALESYQAVSAYTEKYGFHFKWVAPRLGVRSGSKVQGKTVLSREDVLNGRKYREIGAHCSWPIEFWGPGGGLRLEMLKEKDYYTVPPGALEAVGIDNLLLAGLQVSGDADATASFRVIGTCFSTGAAAGISSACKAGCISLEQSVSLLAQEFQQ